MDHQKPYGYLTLNHAALFQTTAVGGPVMDAVSYPPIPGQQDLQTYFVPRLTKLGEQYIRLYIDVFRFDPFFAEYMTCSVCGQYHSADEWHNLAFTCTGSKNDPHEPNFMTDAWDDRELRLSWFTKFRDPSIKGWVMIYKPTTQVVGFTFGRLTTKKDLLARWDGVSGNRIFKAGSETVCYYDELGVSVAHRDQELGKWLAVKLTTWMKTEHPDGITVLRTHGDCPARKLYEKLGYRQIGADTEHGQGRIMMAAECNLLTPEALRFKKLDLD